MARKLITERRVVFLIEALNADRRSYRTRVYCKIERADPHRVHTTVDAFAAIQFSTEAIAEQMVPMVRAAAPEIEWKVEPFLYPFTLAQIAAMSTEETVSEC